MRRQGLFAIALAACNYAPPAPAGVGDDTQPADAPPADAPPIDMPPPPPDVPVAPVTTTFESGADIYLRTDVAPNENTNDRDFVIVDGDNVATPLFRFDLTAIPATATVIAATLQVFCIQDPGEPATFHQLLESWDEATATSNQRMTGVAWMGAGASPPSRSTTVMGNISPAQEDTFYDVPLDLATVQNWVAKPDANFGMALVTNNDDGSRFSSREESVAMRRPKLTITYQP